MSILQKACTYGRILLLGLVFSASHTYGSVSTPLNTHLYSSASLSDIENLDQDLLDESADLYLKKCKNKTRLTYYLFVEDFIKSFIEIPTSNVSGDSTTTSSKYLAGRAPVYNLKNEKVGTCSASFLCMQNQEASIFTDISNYLSIDNGLIVSWFTPTTLLNLELDTITRSMVTECIVLASTKVGFNPFYGKYFNMIVSSDQSKIYFQLYKIKRL